jgi:hypothetical protein
LIFTIYSDTPGPCQIPGEQQLISSITQGQVDRAGDGWRFLEHDEKTRNFIGKIWENVGKSGKMWENDGKMWENDGKHDGKMMEHDGKMRTPKNIREEHRGTGYPEDVESND